MGNYDYFSPPKILILPFFALTEECTRRSSPHPVLVPASSLSLSRLLFQADRSKDSAVLQIQSVVRGFLARRRVRRLARQELETLHNQMTAKTSVPVENYRQLGVALLRSYQPQSDTELFAWFSQALVKLRQELVQLVSTNIQWRYLVSRLLKLAIDYLIDNQTSVASSLRFIQVYTDAGNYPSNGRITVTKIFKYLLTNDYFAKVRQLVDLRIPPLLEETTRPPNPVSAEILGMIVRPLAVVEQCEETGLVTEVMVQLCKHLLAPAMTDQVRLYLLPSLCESQTFPLANRLVQGWVIQWYNNSDHP